MGYIDRITDLSGNYTVYNYDLKGQLLSEEQFDANNNRIYKNQYSYDINGNITKRYYFDSVGITPDIDNMY